MIPLAEHDEPSLAAQKKQRHVALEKATPTPKNRVWNFFGSPLGRPGVEPDLSAETATGSVQFSYENASGRAYYYTRDHLRNVREMVNSSGTIVARYSYDPYGRATLVSGTNIATFQYTGGYYHSASGLNLTLNRAYDAGTGRWLSRDPLPDVEMDQGANIYEYAADDPIRYFDELGLAIGTDDAGRKCDCADMKPVIEREYTPVGGLSVSSWIPHTFLVTPFGTFGHYPKKEGSPLGPGTVHNDTGHPFNRSRTFKACPETVTILSRSIFAHLNDGYDVTNETATNCTAWADARLADAGLTGIGWSWLNGATENPWTHGW